MRVMVLVKATKDSEVGITPSTELLDAMGKYNEELVAELIGWSRSIAEKKRAPGSSGKESLVQVGWHRQQPDVGRQLLAAERMTRRREHRFAPEPLSMMRLGLSDPLPLVPARAGTQGQLSAPDLTLDSRLRGMSGAWGSAKRLNPTSSRASKWRTDSSARSPRARRAAS